MNKGTNHQCKPLDTRASGTRSYTCKYVQLFKDTCALSHQVEEHQQAPSMLVVQTPLIAYQTPLIALQTPLFAILLLKFFARSGTVLKSVPTFHGRIPGLHPLIHRGKGHLQYSSSLPIVQKYLYKLYVPARMPQCRNLQSISLCPK